MVFTRGYQWWNCMELKEVSLNKHWDESVSQMSQRNSNSRWLPDQQRSHPPLNKQQMKDRYTKLTPVICPTEYHWLVLMPLFACVHSKVVSDCFIAEVEMTAVVKIQIAAVILLHHCHYNYLYI